MPVTTHIDRASDRTATEQDAVAAKSDAVDTFIGRVKSLSPNPIRSAPVGMTATVGTLAGQTTSTEDRCRAVRTAFAETIRPHSVDDIDSDESPPENSPCEARRVKKLFAVVDSRLSAYPIAPLNVSLSEQLPVVSLGQPKKGEWRGLGQPKSVGIGFVVE